MNRESRPKLVDLADSLDFVHTHYKTYGRPNPGAFLDALANAYQTDPDALVSALRSAGVVGEGLPVTDKMGET